MGKQCVVNTVCGSPRNPAAHWFMMKESPVDHNYYALFSPIAGPVVFGVSCCEECKKEIEARLERAAVS